MYPLFFRKRLPLKLQEEIMELPDGDFIEVSWTTPLSSGPIVILLHGLEGSVHSPYSRGLLKTVQNAGWQGVTMHFRGCGKRHNRLPRSYHAGETGDLDLFIQTLKTRFPKRRLAVVGVSLGGNVLLKYLGEKKEDSGLAAAMAISVPFDLVDSAHHLGKGLSRIYQKYLITRLRKKTKARFNDKIAPIDLGRIDQWHDFFSFDDNVTAPLHGFSSAVDYYTRSSSRQFLKDIVTPTLILHSKDDPLMPEKTIPTETQLGTGITLELTERGGHIGFIYDGLPLREKYWTEKRLRHFFGNLL